MKKLIELYCLVKSRYVYIYAFLWCPFIIFIDILSIQLMLNFSDGSLAQNLENNAATDLIYIVSLIVVANILSLLNIYFVQYLAAQDTKRLAELLAKNYSILHFNDYLNQKISEYQSYFTAKINLLNFNGFVQVYNVVLAVLYLTSLMLLMISKDPLRNGFAISLVSLFFYLLYFFSRNYSKVIGQILKSTLNNINEHVRTATRLQIEAFLSGNVTRFSEKIISEHSMLRHAFIKQELIGQSPRYLFLILIGVAILFYIILVDINVSSANVASLLALGYALQRTLPLFQQLYVGLNKMRSINNISNDYIAQIGINTAHPKSDKGTTTGINDDVVLNADNISVSMGDTKMFAGLKFALRSGETYLLDGSSGSGKSTLIKAICGAVESNGIQFREISRNNPLKIGYVQQNVPLLAGTIGENLIVPRPCLDTKLVDILELHDIFKTETLSDLLAALIAPEGTNLSGGQMQRIGILRAFSSSPDLLIMDEAFANIPQNMAQKIIKYVQEHDRITCIYTTHDDTLKSLTRNRISL